MDDASSPIYNPVFAEGRSSASNNNNSNSSISLSSRGGINVIAASGDPAPVVSLLDGPLPRVELAGLAEQYLAAYRYGLTDWLHAHTLS